VNTYDALTFDMLQANVELLAENERLDLERKRLVELDQMKTEFLARLSHDLRTPLNSIIGFSELITGDVGGKMNKKHAEFVAAINRNGHALLSMINELLDLSSLETGHVHLRLETMSLQTLLDDLKAATEPVLVQAGIAMQWPDEKHIAQGKAVVDRRRIMQTLVNLVDNARKFTPRGGMIAVTMSSTQDQALFTIRDSGPGIPPSEQDRIFKPYYQRPATATASAKNGQSGVGLGLAIVRSIVQRHGGNITLDSDIGKGCCFTVAIPHRVQTEQMASAHEGAPQ
jgi:signal transduction histidine kinase